MTDTSTREPESGREPNHRPESRLAVWLSYAVLLAGIGAGIASAYIVITTYSPLPHWDEWALFDHLAQGHGWSLSWLWAQHNEHRIFVTKFFFLLDVQFFHGTQVFLLLSIFLAQLLQVALLSWSLRVLGGVRGGAWRAGTGLIAYAILCPTQYENLVWGFQLQFVVPGAMATLAFLALLLCQRHQHERSSRTRLLIICIAAASVATWSLANGMLLWPLLIIASLLLRMGRPVWTKLLLLAAVNIGLYFFHYHRPVPIVSLPSMSISERLQYVAVYLGSTWVRHSSGAIAVILGVLGICASLIVVYQCVRKTPRPELLKTQLSLLMIFCLLTAAATSSGRIHLGIQQATASRYQTFALLFWCCLGLVLIVEAAHHRYWFEVLSIVLLTMMLAFATQVRLPLIDAEWHQLRLKMISNALLAGVRDPAVLSDAYPNPLVVARSAGYMRLHRLSIFAGSQYAELDQPLTADYRVTTPAECTGYVSSIYLIPADDNHAYKLTGFARDAHRETPVRDVLVATDGRVRGFGSNIAIPLTLRHAGPHADASRYGWLAFVGGVAPGHTIHLFAVIGNGARDVCQFATASP